MRSQRGSEQETELKHYYIISDHQHRMKKEQTILDAILENENIIFSAAIILSAVANGRFGRFASTMSWQIIAPALVTSLSDVFFITGSSVVVGLFFLGNSLQQPGICHRPCQIPCGTCS